MFVVFILIWVFRDQFFSLMRWVMMGIAEAFLTNYIFL